MTAGNTQRSHERTRASYLSSVARDESPVAIGRRIHQRRIELGLSQRQLSGPGVSYAYISRIEAGARRPSVRALRRLAPKLNASVHWLETGEVAASEELARLIVDYHGEPPQRRALTLAFRVLDEGAAEGDGST
jgi:transcriptional regulator with XRE-family HTH domain